MRQQDNIARLELIQEYTREMTLYNVDLERIVIETEEFHEADLALMCAEAELLSKIEKVPSMYDDDTIDFYKLDPIVVEKHFIDAIYIIKHRLGYSINYRCDRCKIQSLKAIHKLEKQKKKGPTSYGHIYCTAGITVGIIYFLIVCQYKDILVWSVTVGRPEDPPP